MTKVELQVEIDSLKEQLSAYDYKTIKRIQGVLTDDEWEATKTECAALRSKINDLEAELAEMEEQPYENL